MLKRIKSPIAARNPNSRKKYKTALKRVTSAPRKVYKAPVSPPKVGKPKYALSPVISHKRNNSEEKALKFAAKKMILSSVEDDIKKLQNITDKNLSVRKDLFKVQEKIMVMRMHQQRHPIKEMNETTYKYGTGNKNNPLDLLVEKYKNFKSN